MFAFSLSSISGPFHWLFHTDAGLLTRILIGSAIFAWLALVDLRRNGRAATRWREYAVLLAAVITALLYGAVNDQITVSISPEYFLRGKELDLVIGEHPSMRQLRWEAAKVGFKATWSAGLIFGVALLLANNPHRLLPRLRNRQLLIWLPMIVLFASSFGCLGGWLGYRGHLMWMDSYFRAIVEVDMYRPMRFMAAWGVHLGGYFGGLIGTIYATIAVVRKRRLIFNGSRESESLVV